MGLPARLQLHPGRQRTDALQQLQARPRVLERPLWPVRRHRQRGPPVDVAVRPLRLLPDPSDVRQEDAVLLAVPGQLFGGVSPCGARFTPAARASTKFEEWWGTKC